MAKKKKEKFGKKKRGKAGKNRKSRNNFEGSEWHELVFKEDGQEYARVVQMLGDCRFEAICMDGNTRQCHIRGNMRKNVWIAVGDVVLVGLRDYQDYKADVILKYTAGEAWLLMAYGELSKSFRLDEDVDGDDDYLDDDDIDEFLNFF